MVNKKIQALELISSTEDQKTFTCIRSTQNLDDLSSKFHKTFQECPTWFSEILFANYEKIKQYLTQTK